MQRMLRKVVLEETYHSVAETRLSDQRPSKRFERESEKGTKWRSLPSQLLGSLLLPIVLAVSPRFSPFPPIMEPGISLPSASESMANA